MTKNLLRQFYRSVRKSISEKEKIDYDRRIFTRFVNSRLYNDAESLLIYVSFGSEADTFNIINHALKRGKVVAVPYCKGEEMQFYAIDSCDDLVKGKFGIPTVIPDNKNLISDFSKSLCIVPALSFDNSGSRLGYGGGFYDRFLSDKNITTVGLCFERCVDYCLPAEEHDIKINYILTENRFKKL